MLISTIILVISLLMILLAAEGFTNGIEVFGRKFALSQAVVGSVLAAVGTALPETILPMVAIFFVSGHAAKEIGVGAILGAPFMLATLAFFLIGLTAAVRSRKKHKHFKIAVEISSTQRDLTFFILMYSASVFIPLFTGRALAVPLAILMVLGYVFYVYLTLKGESAKVEHYEGLHLWNLHKKIRPVKRDIPHTLFILLQIALSLFVMVIGARFFVTNLEHLSIKLGMNPLLFALLLAPIATELPEKFNSVTWTLKGKDSLAVGNITGAMVFQSTFPVSVGLLFTEWNLTGMALFSAVIALSSALLVLASILIKKRVSPVVMLLGGGFYLIYAVTLILRGGH